MQFKAKVSFVDFPLAAFEGRFTQIAVKLFFYAVNGNCGLRSLSCIHF